MFTTFRLVLLSFMQHGSLPLAQALSEETIQQAFDDEGVAFAQDEDDVYNPAVTLWAFLSQALFKAEQRSCMAAVARVMVLLVALRREPCSGDTGAYCRARARLPEVVMHRLTIQVASDCEAQVPQRWLWKNRHVQLVDGTTVSMPDTAKNQAAYPQSSSQKPGVGFPIARMVVLISLATAMLTDMEMGPYAGKETGESALLRTMLERLPAGEVLLADRYYCSYFMIALLHELGIDFVVRLHQRRKANFRRGQHLGPDDHIVEWLRPQRPVWMDQETYRRMPESIRVRELRVRINQPGFRVDSLVVVTTLLDPDEYSREDLTELYHRRWLIELDLRAIKINMGMDELRCKTPEMVRREIWSCLLAYNLIRKNMLQAAWQGELSPRQLSFAAAMQKIAAVWSVIVTFDETTALRLIEAQLADLPLHRVGDRPNRVEPRAKKRRPKHYPLLNQPREQARAALLAAG